MGCTGNRLTGRLYVDRLHHESRLFMKKFVTGLVLQNFVAFMKICGVFSDVGDIDVPNFEFFWTN